jgi:hypothetical protein
MTNQRKQFLILWGSGMLGVLSFLLVDLNSFLEMIPLPEGDERPIVGPLLAVASLVQSTILVSVAVIIGMFLARSVGLASPVTEAIAAGHDPWKPLRGQLVPGVLGGILGGLGIILTAFISRLYLPPAVAEKSDAFTALLPLITRLLYGGITEELLLRWGFLTLIVWLGWRVLQKGQESPRPIFFVAAIVLSAVVFGLGHLPLAHMLFPNEGVGLTLFVISANSLFGLIAGFLYWKKGLESAILAHMVAHVVMYTASKVAVPS